MSRTPCSVARLVGVGGPAESVGSLSGFACPNPDCCDFNRFGAGNLRVSERNGKGQAIRRLYCSAWHHRFSERKGSLREAAKLPEEVVLRIVKCLGHGCSVQATADICEVDPQTVERYTQVAGHRDTRPRREVHEGVVAKLQQRGVTNNVFSKAAPNLNGRCEPAIFILR